jgi:hypothetical protein
MNSRGCGRDGTGAWAHAAPATQSVATNIHLADLTRSLGTEISCFESLYLRMLVERCNAAQRP